MDPPTGPIPCSLATAVLSWLGSREQAIKYRRDLIEIWSMGAAGATGHIAGVTGMALAIHPAAIETWTFIRVLFYETCLHCSLCRGCRDMWCAILTLPARENISSARHLYFTSPATSWIETMICLRVPKNTDCDYIVALILKLKDCTIITIPLKFVHCSSDRRDVVVAGATCDGNRSGRAMVLLCTTGMGAVESFARLAT